MHVVRPAGVGVRRFAHPLRARPRRGVVFYHQPSLIHHTRKKELMAVVTDLPTGLVVGQYIFVSQDSADEGTAPDAVLVTGSVRFTCSATPPLIYKSKRVSAVPLTHEAQFDSQGYLTPLGLTQRGIELLADVDGVSPRGFTWQVSFNLTEVATGRLIVIPSFSIQVSAGETVDLVDAQPVGSSNGVPITRGESAYEVAVRNGFKGSEATWLASLGGSGGGTTVGAGYLLLGVGQPVPANTPSGTLIVRTSATIPVNPTPEPEVPAVTPEPTPTPTPEVPALRAPAVAGSVQTFGAPSTKTVTFNKPADAAVGDVLVAVVHNQAASGVFTLPDGWELLAGGTQNAALRLTAIATHRVTASSPSSWTFNYSSAGRMVGGMFRVTGATAGTLLSGKGESVNPGPQNAVVSGFALAGRSLVIMAAHAQATTANPWPLPSTIDNPAMTPLFELGDNEANKASATNSILSVYVGPADTFPTTTIRYGQLVSSAAGVAAGILGA